MSLIPIISSFIGKSFSQHPVQPTWSLASVPNLTMWYDASDTGSTIVTNGVLTEWKDKSGNGYDISQSFTNMPFYSSSGGPNNLAYLNFTGSSYMYRAGINLSASNAYALMRYKDLTPISYSGTGYKRVAIGYAGNVSGLMVDMGTEFTSSLTPGYQYIGGYANLTIQNSANTNWQVIKLCGISGSVYPGASAIQVGHEPAGHTCIADKGNVSSVEIGFGYYTQTANYEISEFILVKDSCSINDDNNIRSYLMQKGGISSKPQLHIYGDSLSAGSCNAWNYSYLVSQERNLDLINYAQGGTIVFPNSGSVGISASNFVDFYQNEFIYPSYDGQWGVFFYGVNDVNQGGVNAIWKDTYKSYLQWIIDHGFPRNKMIIVIPPSTTGNAASRAALNEYISEIATELSINLVDMFTVFNNTGDPNSLFLDSLHPNQAGNRLEADTFKTIIT